MAGSLTRAQYAVALKLQRYLGAEPGLRRSAADVARELPAVDQRHPRRAALVLALMTPFVDAGLATPAPGSRGGAGWMLTAKGSELIDAARSRESPRQRRRISLAGKPRTREAERAQTFQAV